MIYTRKQITNCALMVKGSHEDRLNLLGTQKCKDIVSFMDEYKACTTVDEKQELFSRIYQYCLENEPYVAIGLLVMFTLVQYFFTLSEVPQFEQYLLKYTPFVKINPPIDIDLLSDQEYINSLPETYDL